MSSVPVAFAVRSGSEVMASGRRGYITHVIDLDSVLVRDAETGQVSRVRLAELSPTIAAPAESTQQADLELVPDEDWQTAQRRLEIIRPLVGMKRRTRAEVAARARESGVAVATLYGWLASYEASGRLTSLMPRPRNDKGSMKLTPEVEAIIQATLEDDYLTPQRKPISRVCTEVRRRCLNAELDPPHPNTVRNRIAALSESFQVRRRHGRKTAEQAFEPTKGEFPGANWPLSYIQIDHTKLDIILVDDVHRRPITRPWITLAIDVFSRMVAGFYVSFDPPGAMATGLCLAHAILPKEPWLAKVDLDAEWPLWGIPKTLHLDNAREFRGNMLQRACAEYDIDLAWRPVARPNFGGHIERLLGTVLREIHTLPGTTFSNPRERGEYDSDAKATLTLSDFETWLTTYITKVYHLRIHDSLGMAPIEKYREGIFGSAQRPGIGLPARTTDADRLRLDFMPFEMRTIQDYGVVIDEVHYYHDVLRRWIGAKDPDAPKYKRKFLFRRDPRDISTVWFYDPELQTHFAIPYRNTSHPSISVWELREAERIAKEAGKPIDERSIFDAYQHMRAIEEAAKAKTRAARRAGQRRRHHATLDKPASTQPPANQNLTAPTATIEPFDELDDLSS
jgi:putative transposase